MIRTLSVSRVFGNPEQPRKYFDPAKLTELAESIQREGLLQPIKVRPDGNGRFMVVCGERRLRAHEIAGIKTIRADVVSAEELDDVTLGIQAIVENLQRADITPLEEAAAFQRMLDQGIAAEDLAKRLGMKQVFRIFERTTLLNLRAEYQELLRKKILSNAQAYEMSRLPPHLQDRLFALIRDDKCDTYKKLRDAAFALAEAEKQVEMFAPPAPPSAQDLKRHATLEEGVERTLALVRKCFDDEGGVPAAATLDPPRCLRLADLLELARRDLGKIESALRKSAIARAH